MDDPQMDSMGPGGTLQWDATLPGQFNTQAARYPGGPPRKQVTIGGTADMGGSPLEWDGSGGSLGRNHASAQSIADNRRNGNVIKKRNRGSGASMPVTGSGGTSTRASKKLGTAPMSIVAINTAPATQATTPTSVRARSVNESQSPQSVTGSTGNGGSTAGTAAPPKATPGPGASSTGPRTNVSVAPKRQRRHSKSVSAIESMDIDSPENSTGSNEAAKSLGMGMMNSGGSLTNMGLANGFGMTTRPMVPGSMGMTGMGGPPTGLGMPGQNGVGGAGSGPQEWEWLTMSL
ncbi:putative Nitrogen catabolic enzyme regulatory protein [Glarea lozoyensis 74030]|uniref:Putative Nitrogen catabolic enzyme regulatory protein n=1 Tax=Glarea lozoyensis (strain ATCC 74030 / MF5533) TaxID=1104152 RepID=H0ER68_GLAL7|nr:putative Nitrogen catabolic enzyme regulatory protein [Glarea lozoyensis 74030]